MIDQTGVERCSLNTELYEWAFIDGLLSPRDAAELAESVPRDGFKTVSGYDGEKGSQYESRLLIAMGESIPLHSGRLSAVWGRLDEDLLI